MDSIYFDLTQNIAKTANTRFDVIINRDYQASTRYDLVKRNSNTLTGVQSIRIGISESTLSNTYSVDSITDYSINTLISGKLLDCPYRFKIAEKSQTINNIIKSYTGRYDNDLLLYRQFNINYAPRTYYYKKNNQSHTVKYALASDIAKALANVLGLKLYYNAIDFIPSQTVYHIDENDKQTPNHIFSGTYQSILSSLFGWIGSKLPNLIINVWIENDTLYVVQRGAETGKAVNLNDLNILEGASLKSKQIRTMWGGVGSNMPSLGADDSKEPFTGIIEFEKTKAIYKNGYLIQETHGDTITYYLYGSLDDKSNDKYLKKKLTLEKDEEEVDEGQVITTGRISEVEYSYTSTNNEVYQSYQKEVTGGSYDRTVPTGYSKEEMSKLTDIDFSIANIIKNIETYTDWTDAETTITRTIPLYNGWYGQAAYNVTIDEDTGDITEELINSNVTQGASGQKASQYMIDKSNESLDNNKAMYEDLMVLARLMFHGYVFFDNSFPIGIVNNHLGLNTAVTLTNALNDLNLQIEETLTCTVINTDHVITLNDKVYYNGNQYHLKSNNIVRDPYKTVQELTLVRYYHE